MLKSICIIRLKLKKKTIYLRCDVHELFYEKFIFIMILNKNILC